jgi:two-component system, NtrC family, response regulator GlrR
MSTVSSSAPDRARIMIVDDDAALCELLLLRLSAKGYAAFAEATVRSAVKRVERERVDVLLLDLRLGNEDGFDVLDWVRARAPDVRVIVLTAHGSIDTAVDAMRRGAYGFVTKPFHDLDLLQKIAHAVESNRLRREVAGLRRLVGIDEDETKLLGVSPAIEQVRETVARVAKTDATVLLLGESGTGKEIAARAIHALSSRHGQPFVEVHCAGLDPEHLERSLFGHSGGEGVFGVANRGTLFLNEVGEAPPAVQAKLLRVLEEHRFTRVGEAVDQEVDVRLVAATNRDLRHEVTERRFREDLFYRLHVVPISMPPLRERKEDVSVLAEMFLQRAATRHRLPVPELGARALSALVEHSWPGNVRELGNVIEAALLLCRGVEIDVEHLPGVGVAGTPERGIADDFAASVGRLFTSYGPRGTGPLPPLREARDAFERAYLDSVLTKTAGNVSSAARAAGRNRTDFYDLLRRHGLTPADYKRSE